jgi:putative peptidoglycan lipid II flippase
MRGLALGLNGAFWLQWAVTYPKTRSLLKGAALEKTSWKQIGVLLRPFSLAVLGVTATQINSALDAIFAQLADPQGPALLWYALRFQQLPLALIGLATATALLPPLTRAYQSQDLEKAASFFKLAIQQAFQSMVPLTGILIVLAEPMIKLVYQHGAFTPQAAYLTAQCLKGYALGLLPMSLVMILAAPFYANKDYLTVAKLSVGTVVLNMALNACMVYGFKTGAVGIALATALSAWFNVAALLWIDKKKIFDRSFLKTMTITCIAGALAHLVVMGVKIQAPLGSLLIQLSSGAMTYLVLYALMAKVTNTRLGVLRIRKPSEY